MPINITLPDGSVQEHQDGTSGYEIASGIGSRLAKAAVAVTVDGEMSLAAAHEIADELERRAGQEIPRLAEITTLFELRFPTYTSPQKSCTIGKSCTCYAAFLRT